MKAIANQLYPPEPPLSFPSARSLEAQQTYPPEPPFSFPPPREKLADQLYPPEPPLSFPLTRADPHDEDAATEPPPEPKAILVSDGVEDTAARAATSNMRTADEQHLSANAISRQDLPELRVGHAKSLKALDLTQLYIASTLLLLVVGLLAYSVRRQPNDKSKKQTDRTVEFSDSYEPFLG